MNLLGIFDLILALGAICAGIMMVSSKMVFSVFPREWILKVPFESWFVPGIIAIVVFGVGNLMAAFFSFKKNSNRPWLFSAFMGGIFFISILFQVIILGEWYLATLEFLIFSILQISLSIYCVGGDRKQDIA
ncbi:hypothetical protein FRZ06_10305 [Anoxybacterium hadale]|uniref:Uncharacterized protein n=2 Tax=Anoxybacterium hadale TaxID=3408580 RepID=A0ACD1AHS8_9FIRM|nr:hypothetical protein FRZ06_10305 [Clostridiales bacterium]